MENQILKDGDYVMSPIDVECGVGIIKKGEKFKVSQVNVSVPKFKFNFKISINGDSRYCLLNGCEFLKGGNWIIHKPTSKEKIINFFKKLFRK